jgi:hypothetical protein
MVKFSHRKFHGKHIDNVNPSKYSDNWGTVFFNLKKEETHSFVHVMYSWISYVYSLSNIKGLITTMKMKCLSLW